MIPSDTFVFSVQGNNGGWFALDFQNYETATQPWFSSVWQRMSQALQASHKETGNPIPDWVHWQPWKWCEKTKPGYENRQTIIGRRHQQRPSAGAADG